jgi:hypothetical protein
VVPRRYAAHHKYYTVEQENGTVLSNHGIPEGKCPEEVNGSKLLPLIVKMSS